MIGCALAKPMAELDSRHDQDKAGHEDSDSGYSASSLMERLDAQWAPQAAQPSVWPKLQCGLAVAIGYGGSR